MRPAATGPASRATPAEPNPGRTAASAPSHGRSLTVGRCGDERHPRDRLRLHRLAALGDEGAEGSG
nr:hypothetical protein [Actinomycetales bacterium]